MVADECDMPSLTTGYSSQWKFSKQGKHRHTPFIRGISDAGSVDIEASSMNTTGKSITANLFVAEVIQVVQILKTLQLVSNRYIMNKKD